jgi:hypothetical protein
LRKVRGLPAAFQRMQTDRSAPQVSQTTFQARDSASIEAAHDRGSIAAKNR